MARTSKENQYKQFSAGLAFGLCAYNRCKFEQEKSTVDFALERAIRTWDYSRRFPAIQAAIDDQPGLDLYWIMQYYDQDKRTPWVPFYWDRTSGLPQVLARNHSDFDAHNADDTYYVARRIIEGSPISYEAWAELAGVFLENLDEA